MIRSMLFALALSMLALAAPAFAGDQDFTIVNKSGLAFEEVYVEPSSNKDDWGDELLGDDVLTSGEEAEIEFSGFGKECKFDVMLVDTDKTEWTLERLDLCQIHTFTVTRKGKGLAWAAQ